MTNFFTPNTPLVFATNGQVVANTGTNVLTFTSVHGVQVDTLRVGDSNLHAVFYKEDEGLSISIYRTNAETFIGNLGFLDNSVNLAVPVTFNNASNAATTRTNLGLGWSALTNSNAGTGLVSVNTNGEVVSPTNFWQVAPITTTFIDSQPTTNQTTNIAAGRNLHIHSIAPSTVGITNTVALPTTNSFNGDIALVVHQGPTSSVTAVRTAGASTNLITLNQFEEAVEFVYYNSVWQFNHNQSFVEPIFFSGTNAASNRVASRTNLGLPLAALTNTDVTNFRTAIGLGTTNNVAFSNIASSGTLTSTGVVTALSNAVVGGTLTSTGVFTALSNAVVGGTLTATGSVTALSNVSVAGTLTATGSVTTVTNLNVGGAINVTNKAETRTNLGIPLAALTQTNNANFQAAIFNTNSIPINGANVNAVNFNTAIHWMEVNVVTNGVTNNFRIPLFK